jgi:hypothetical protein
MSAALTGADDVGVVENRRTRPTPVVQEVRGVAKKTAPTLRGAQYLPSFQALKASRHPDRQRAARRFETLVAMKKR